MSARGEGGLPAWAARYVPQFERVLRAVSLTEEFVLLPIEVPSADVARALASWLEAQGHPALVVEPKSEEAWRHLAATLLGATLAEEGVAVVIGPREVPKGMLWGLRLLNQRRDTTARNLKRPLLWCGTKEFLDETWQSAPDLWSVASVPIRIEVAADAAQETPPPVEWTGEEISESPEQLRELYEAAKAQGDVRNAARLGLRLADALGHRSEFRAARDVAEEVKESLRELDEPQLRARAYLLLGRLALMMSNLDAAENALLEARTLAFGSEDRLAQARTLEALGDLYVHKSSLARAETAYTDALALFRLIDERLGQANTLAALGDLYLRTARLADAEKAYSDALALFRLIGARLGLATTLTSLGDLYLSAARLADAEKAYTDALALFRLINARLGQATTLQGFGRLALARRDGATAFSWFLEALTIHVDVDEALGIAADHDYLARASLAVGNPTRAAALAGKALAMLEHIKHRFGQMLALDTVVQAFVALEELQGVTAAIILSWARAREIEHPSVEKRSELVAQIISDFDPVSPLPPERLAAYRQQLADAIAACEEKLREKGEDPYAPLDG